LDELGIEINITKSKLYTGKRGTQPIFEFAKRISVSNKEITGLPIDLVKASSKSIYDYVDLVYYLIETKLIPAGGTLALPRNLSPKGKFFLEVLLWEKSLGRPAWLDGRLGNVFEETTLLNELRKQVARVRVQGFTELIGNLDKLCYSSSLEAKLTEAGVAFSETLIGYGSGFYHPIVYSLNNVGMKMYDTLPILEAIENADANSREVTLPELTALEYLPLPYMSAYFQRPGKRNPERLRKHSQLVLTASQQLRGPTYGFLMVFDAESKANLPGNNREKILST